MHTLSHTMSIQSPTLSSHHLALWTFCYRSYIDLRVCQPKLLSSGFLLNSTYLINSELVQQWLCEGFAQSLFYLMADKWVQSVQRQVHLPVSVSLNIICICWRYVCSVSHLFKFIFVHSII